MKRQCERKYYHNVFKGSEEIKAACRKYNNSDKGIARGLIYR